MWEWILCCVSISTNWSCKKYVAFQRVVLGTIKPSKNLIVADKVCVIFQTKKMFERIEMDKMDSVKPCSVYES